MPLAVEGVKLQPGFDPSSPQEGDLWYNSGLVKPVARCGTTTRALVTTGHADGSVLVDANGVAQVGVLATDAQHGVRGGGTQHAVVTQTVAGFMSSADKTKLDGLVGGLRQSDWVEVTADVSTNSGTFVNLFSRTLTLSGLKKLLIFFSATCSNTTSAGKTVFRLSVDGTPLGGSAVRSPGGGDQSSAVLIHLISGLAAGPHTVTIDWRVTGGTTSIKPTTLPELEHGSLMILESDV